MLERRPADRQVAVEVDRLRPALTSRGREAPGRPSRRSPASAGCRAPATSRRICATANPYLASALPESSLTLFIESSGRPPDHMNITRVAHTGMAIHTDGDCRGAEMELRCRDAEQDDAMWMERSSYSGFGCNRLGSYTVRFSREARTERWPTKRLKRRNCSALHRSVRGAPLDVRD